MIAHPNEALMKQLRIAKAVVEVVPLHPIVYHGNGKQVGFTYHKDADVITCPAGERSIRKKKSFPNKE